MIVRVYSKPKLEEWRSIPGIPGYEISTDARVRSIDRVVSGRSHKGRELARLIDSLGYWTVGLRHGRSGRARVHRLMALAFLGEPPFKGAVVRHLNDQKTDNRIENLSWGSRSDNAFDAISNGAEWGVKGKLVCKRGHPLLGTNVRVDGKSKSRICRSCSRVMSLYLYRKKIGQGTSQFETFLKGDRMTIVRVYTKPNCGACVVTKRALTAEGIPFVEEDITDPQNLEAAKSLGFLAAPVVVVGESGDDMWAGFQPDRIKEIARRINGT